MSESNELLRKAIVVMATDPENALLILDEGMDRLESLAEPHDVSKLARHAAVIAVNLGRLDQAKSYCLKAIRFTPADPAVRWFHAFVLRNLGESIEARREFEESLRLATEQGRLDDVELAQVALAVED